MKSQNVKFIGGPWDGQIINYPLNPGHNFILHDSADTGWRVITTYRKVADIDGIPAFVFESDKEGAAL